MKIDLLWWHVLIITALWETEAESLQFQAQPRQLSDVARLYLKRKKKKEKPYVQPLGLQSNNKKLQFSSKNINQYLNEKIL